MQAISRWPSETRCVRACPIPSSSSCTTDENRGSSVRRLTVTDRHARREPRHQPVAAQHARQDQPVDAARTHGLEHLGLAPRIAVGIGQHRDIVMLRQPILDAADDRRKDRIGDVRNDHADRARAVGLEQIGGSVPAGSRAAWLALRIFSVEVGSTGCRDCGSSARETVETCTPTSRAMSLRVIGCDRFVAFFNVSADITVHWTDSSTNSVAHELRTSCLFRRPSRTDRPVCPTCIFGRIDHDLPRPVRELARSRRR